MFFYKVYLLHVRLLHVLKCSADYMYFYQGSSLIYLRDFPMPDLGPSQFKNEQKLPKMVYIIPNILVLHLGENQIKNTKVTVA